MKTKWPALGFGCLLLACAAVVVQPARAQTVQETSAGIAQQPASISNVAIARTGQQTTVRISGSGELRYQASRLESPARLVLDFADTRLADTQRKLSSEYVPVLGVRLGQPNPGQSRIVIDLEKQVPFDAQMEGSNVVVSFAVPAAAAIPAQLRSVKKPQQQKLVAMHAPQMPLPTWLSGNDSGFASPAGQPRPPEPQNAPVAAPQVATTREKYTGDPISVNLKDVDLKDFFRLIHEISGLNVVLDPAVRGTVTLVLDEVPWDQGLDIVLRNNGLTKEIDGNVLRIATQESLKREADQERDLLKAQSDAIELVTVTRVLSYATANTALATTLKRFLSARGDIYPDPRSNTLIVRDIPSSIPRIDDLIRQLDKKSQQVEIDARVVQASRSFAREVGTQFGFTTPTGATGNTVLGGLVGNSAFVSPVIHALTGGLPFSSGGAIPLNTNLGATAPNSGFTFSTQGHNYAIDFVLSLMESRGLGKVLSEPKGVTQNNQKLTVKQGVKVPIQTNINNTIAIQFIDAVLKLEVTPQITADGTVFLDVTVENTQIDTGIPRIQGTPALDTQSTETKVLINDGGTIVIGGVVISNQTTSIDQVPLLGSMPLIGNLFKHSTVNVSTQELLFFVTPRILPG
jgi:type IV pilus assembly protein PilQ